MKGLNSAELDQRLLKLSTALVIQKEVRKCRSLRQLYSYLTTETASLHGHEQAFLFRIRGTTLSFLAAGNVSGADPDAPLNRTITKSLHRYLRGRSRKKHVQQVHRLDEPEIVSCTEGLAQHWLWLPLHDGTGSLIGALLLLRNSPWHDREILLAETMAEAYGYTLAALQNRPRFRLKWRPVPYLTALLVLGLLYWVQVPLLTFGEAQVVSESPIPVSAPFPGVVKTIHTAPFTAVARGDLLIRLDTTDLQADRDVAEKNLEVVTAEFDKIQLESYRDASMKSQLAIWQQKIQLQRRELEFAEQRLSQCEVRAGADGIVSYDDRHSWEGRPVMTGERIMELLDPSRRVLRIEVPAKGMAPLQPHMPVRFFPDAQPSAVVGGHLTTIGMEPFQTADGSLVYSHRAQLDQASASVALGSRGTVRISGEPVRLGYYLFRRPLARLRQFLGL